MINRTDVVDRQRSFIRPAGADSALRAPGRLESLCREWQLRWLGEGLVSASLAPFGRELRHLRCY